MTEKQPLLFFTLLVFITSVLYAEGNIEPTLAIKKLTDYKWKHIRHHGPHFSAEVTTWEFYRDGSFRWSFTSDYLDSYTGGWAISGFSHDQGVVFLASTAGGPMQSRFHVLSFEFFNKGLRLGEKIYQGVAFSDRETAPRIKADERSAVTSQNNRFSPLWVAITSYDWQSDSAPSASTPSKYSFAGDGNYTAYFETTQCQYSGTWSLLSSGDHTGAIRFSIPANPCSPLRSNHAFIRELPIELKNKKLILYKTTYISNQKEDIK